LWHWDKNGWLELNEKRIMFLPKAINRKKLVAFIFAHYGKAVSPTCCDFEIYNIADNILYR
jgi:hypothetical protein